MLEKKTDGHGWVGQHTFPSVAIGYPEKLVELAKANNLYLPGHAFWPVKDRNYALFGALAGVLDDGPEARGLPDDISPLAKDFVTMWGADGHTHTWYTLDEALPIFAAHCCPDELLGESRHWISNRLFEVDHDDLANYRLIIFFDN